MHALYAYISCHLLRIDSLKPTYDLNLNYRERERMNRKHLPAVTLTLLLFAAPGITLLLVNNTPVPNANFNGLAEIESLLNAPANSVYFMYHTNSSFHDSPPTRTVMNMCKNPQVEISYELNDAWVDSNGHPKPDKIDSGKYIVLFGGPYSQPCVKYYEQAGQDLITFECNSSHIWWETRKKEILGKTPRFELDEHHDVFVMKSFVDYYGRKVLISYGYDWKGTLAASLYCRTIYKKNSQYNNSYHVFHWVDWDNNLLPDTKEVFERKPRYVSIQAALTGANLDRVQWFADACHSRGLKVTWYPDEEALHREDVLSLLGDFLASGDRIGLSFGQTFFNQMEPAERLQYVDGCMATFRDTFGYYPHIIQSYYIDAYTLNHISTQYPTVKAAIAYVNHEVYCDHFKSVGAYYMPYYPSKMNTLLPSSDEDKVDIVALPYIHRDITNCILHQNVNYNLNPQDGYKVAKNWTKYFRELFQAYTEGWDLFGLALYLIDLAYHDLPTELIEQDLSYIQKQVQSRKCSNLLDIEFVSWFRSEFQKTPSYRWVYTEPGNRSSLWEWRFTPYHRTGYINGEIYEVRTYSKMGFEACYGGAVRPYDNSIPQD